MIWKQTAEELAETVWMEVQDFLEPEDLESEPAVEQDIEFHARSLDHHAIIPTRQVKSYRS